QATGTRLSLRLDQKEKNHQQDHNDSQPDQTRSLLLATHVARPRLLLPVGQTGGPSPILFRFRRRAARIQQIVQEYAERAGITEHVPPPLFRHQVLTWLTAQGLPDAAIQLISGHASKKLLEVYQHLSLAQVEPGYQRAVTQLEI